MSLTMSGLELYELAVLQSLPKLKLEIHLRNCELSLQRNLPLIVSVKKADFQLEPPQLDLNLHKQ